MQPIFDENQIKDLIKAQPPGLRINIATSLMNGMIQGPLMETARSTAFDLIMRNEDERTRIKVVSNGKPQQTELTQEQIGAIKNTAFIIMIRDAFQLADQMIAANAYIKPGELLIVPHAPTEEIKDANPAQAG